MIRNLLRSKPISHSHSNTSLFTSNSSHGNGRISRFLVNDVLRRDGAVPAPFILPVSATITHSASERVDYDRTLERFSRPLMRHMAERYRFGEEREYEDGVRSNFHFDAYDEVLPAWRYRNLTAREAVKNYLEGPDTDIDAIIRSVRATWTISGKLRRQFPQLEDGRLAANIVHALKEVFEPSDEASLDDEDPGQDAPSPHG